MNRESEKKGVCTGEELVMVMQKRRKQIEKRKRKKRKLDVRVIE